jgi:hypothetical protein
MPKVSLNEEEQLVGKHRPYIPSNEVFHDDTFPQTLDLAARLAGRRLKPTNGLAMAKGHTQ